MTDTEMLQAMEKLLDKKLEPINNKLNELNESMGIVIDWIDEAARDKHLPPFASGQQM